MVVTLETVKGKNAAAFFAYKRFEEKRTHTPIMSV
jgi:hypothetical protein